MSRELTKDVFEENGFELTEDSSRRLCFRKFHFSVYNVDDQWRLVNIRNGSDLKNALIIRTEQDLKSGMIEVL